MEYWDREKLAKEMEESKRDDLIKTMEECNFHEEMQFFEELNMNNCENVEEIKILEDFLSDGQKESGDVAYIVQNVAENIAGRKSVDHELERVNALIAKNADKANAAWKAMENFDFDGYGQELLDSGEALSMENIIKLTPEQVNEKMHKIVGGLQEIREKKGGLGPVPEVSETLKRYERILKNFDAKPKGAIPSKDFKPPIPNKKPFKEVLLQRAEELKMPEGLRRIIERMGSDDNDDENKKNAYQDLLNMARGEGVKDQNLPEYLKNILLPDFMARASAWKK